MTAFSVANGGDDLVDALFVGTGIVSMLEALYQDRQGRSVVMIDDQPKIGGAWTPWTIFGLDDVENAVHYLLPHPRALTFLREVLDWPIVRARGKFLLFPAAGARDRRVPFDSQRARLRARLTRSEGASPLELARIVAYWGKQSLAPANWRSHYIEGGTPEILRRMTELLRRSGVRIRLSTEITGIDVRAAHGRVDLRAGSELIACRTIYLTHGSVVRSLRNEGTPITVPHERHRRPQVHLLVRDESPAEVLEGVFVHDPMIKYVHDVTRFTRAGSTSADGLKVLVLALHPQSEELPGIYAQLVARLHQAGVIGESARLQDHHWWDCHLPPLSTETLLMLQRELAPLVSVLRTENFTEAIGLNVARWAPVLRGVVSEAGPGYRSRTSPA